MFGVPVIVLKRNYRLGFSLLAHNNCFALYTRIDKHGVACVALILCRMQAAREQACCRLPAAYPLLAGRSACLVGRAAPPWALNVGCAGVNSLLVFLGIRFGILSSELRTLVRGFDTMLPVWMCLSDFMHFSRLSRAVQTQLE